MKSEKEKGNEVTPDNPPKPKRGRPKVPWDPFDDELYRRFRSGEALETVEAESRYLHKWAKEKGIKVDGGAPISAARIRARINTRYGKAEGYKQTRAHHLSEIQTPSSTTDDS